jgi:hypothetical protein
MEMLGEILHDFLWILKNLHGFLIDFKIKNVSDCAMKSAAGLQEKAQGRLQVFSAAPGGRREGAR